MEQNSNKPKTSRAHNTILPSTGLFHMHAPDPAIATGSQMHAQAQASGTRAAIASNILMYSAGACTLQLDLATSDDERQHSLAKIMEIQAQGKIFEAQAAVQSWIESLLNQYQLLPPHSPDLQLQDQIKKGEKAREEIRFYVRVIQTNYSNSPHQIPAMSALGKMQDLISFVLEVMQRRNSNMHTATSPAAPAPTAADSSLATASTFPVHGLQSPGRPQLQHIHPSMAPRDQSTSQALQPSELSNSTSSLPSIVQHVNLQTAALEGDLEVGRLETIHRHVAEQLASCEDFFKCAMKDWGQVLTQMEDRLVDRIERRVKRRRLELEETYECPICLEDKDHGERRLLLGCGHVFCLHCAQEHAEMSKRCPTCCKPFQGFSPIFD